MFLGALRVLRDPPLSGHENMARDEALLLVGELPTLRFFLWREPTLSLGRYQKTQEVDFAFLEGAGIPLVRRPTGGRAILHGEEVTFSLFLPRNEKPYTHRALYMVVREVLRRAFADIGITVDAPSVVLPSVHSPACFSLSLPHELAVAGKKVAGIAQAQSRRGNLFEGSIPFRLDRDLFASCFREKEKVLQELCAGAVGLWEIRSDLAKDEFVEALVAHFGALFAETFSGTWGERELFEAERLLREKYSPCSPYHCER